MWKKYLGKLWNNSVWIILVIPMYIEIVVVTITLTQTIDLDKIWTKFSKTKRILQEFPYCTLQLILQKQP